MTKQDEKAARCEYYAGAWSWVFKDKRPVEPFDITGGLGIYDVAVDLVKPGVLKDKIF